MLLPNVLSLFEENINTYIIDYELSTKLFTFKFISLERRSISITLIIHLSLYAYNIKFAIMITLDILNQFEPN